MLLEAKIDALHRLLKGIAFQIKKDFETAKTAFLERDAGLAEELEKQEISQDSFEEDIIKLLALHQPVASDLKKVIRLFKVGQELEILRSYIQKIAKKTRKLSIGPMVCEPTAFKTQLYIVGYMVSDFADLVESWEMLSSLERVKELELGSYTLKKDIVTRMENELHDASGATIKQVLFIQGISRNLDHISKTISIVSEDYFLRI